jgi:outer membrane lipoprotein-sorting protein
MHRMGLFLQHLLRYADEKEDVLNRIVTGDESWVHHYQPESKRASIQWQSDGTSVSMLVEDMSRNKCLFQVRISHVLRFTSICDLFTDSPLYITT